MKPVSPRILTINGGSSSIKFAVFEAGDPLRRILEGGIERIGLPEAMFVVKGLNQTDNFSRLVTAPDHTVAVGILMDWIEERIRRGELTAVGHRVVHGGEHFAASVVIDEKVEEEIQNCVELAPLHNPHNLRGYFVARKVMPQVPQVAVFDTAFHQTMPGHAYMYGLPYSYYRRYHIRRYGFHGTSHRYVAFRYRKIFGKQRDEANLITAHLGNGCSITAIEKGHSIDTSMGFTPLEGLVMGSRSGDHPSTLTVLPL